MVASLLVAKPLAGPRQTLRSALPALADPAISVGMWLTFLAGLAFGVIDVLAPLRLNRLGAGAIVIAFGLMTIDFVRWRWLLRDFRFHPGLPGGQTFSAYVLGLAFALGWTPCIGPVLGAILTTSAVSATVAQGVILLTAYSLGLGIPFLASALFTDRLVGRLKRLGRLGRTLQIGAGGVMVAMGVAMVTGQLSAFSYWLLETFPVFQRIG